VCEEPPWQLLATATHLNPAPPPQSADEAASKPHILDWEQALQRNELQLLQLHMGQQLLCRGEASRVMQNHGQNHGLGNHQPQPELLT